MTWQLVIETVGKYWLQFILSGMSGLIVFLWKRINTARQEQKKATADQKAEDVVIKNAVRALLRDRLYQACNYYLSKGEVTTSEFEVLNGLFTAYEKLEGNGVAHAIYDRVKNHCKIVIEENG